MMQEKLIELVRENAALYDMTHKKYSDANYKDRLWNEIGNHLKQKASNCKKTWTLLRDSYRRAVKRKKETKSGQAASKYKRWRFEEEMSFLEPFLVERPSKSSLNVDLAEDSAKETIENEARIEDNTEGEIILNETNVAEVNFIPSSSKHCKKAKRIENISSTVMKYLIEEQKKEKKEQSSIRSFFLSMADTVEKFSPYNQHKAKSRIFSIISEIEYDELTTTNRSQFHPVNSWEPASETLQKTNNL